jgi:hypothetical protein
LRSGNAGHLLECRGATVDSHDGDVLPRSRELAAELSCARADIDHRAYVAGHQGYRALYANGILSRDEGLVSPEAVPFVVSLLECFHSRAVSIPPGRMLLPMLSVNRSEQKADPRTG